MSLRKHRYTKEQIDYIKKIAPDNTCDGIVEKFNKKFNLNQSKKSLKGIRYRHNIRVGVINNPTQFKKGHKPWSKGKKGLNYGGKETQFKKGKYHNNYKPIGSEVINQGYTLVKTGDPDKWERKHYLMYEKYHGKVPDGKLVIFADKDKNNFSKDNLILVSKGQLRRIHHEELVFEDTNLTKLGLSIVKLKESLDGRVDDV